MPQNKALRRRGHQRHSVVQYGDIGSETRQADKIVYSAPTDHQDVDGEEARDPFAVKCPEIPVDNDNAHINIIVAAVLAFGEESREAPEIGAKGCGPDKKLHPWLHVVSRQRRSRV